MATVEFRCGRCGKHYSLDAALAGKKARCKQCGNVFAVPAASQAAGPADVFGLDDLAAAASGPAVSRSRTGLDDAPSPPPRARAAATRPKATGGSGANSQTIKTVAGVGSFLVAFGLIFGARVLLRGALNAALDQGGDPAVADADADPEPSPPPAHRPPPQAQAPAQAAFPKSHARLSNGSAFRARSRLGNAGAGVGFRVDFEFDGPGPIGGFYFWVVESQKGIARNPMPLHAKRGTLSGSVSTMSPEDGPFSAFIAMQIGDRFEKVSEPLALNYSEQPPVPEQAASPSQPQMGGPPPGFPHPPGGPPPGPRFRPRGPRFGPRGPRGGPP